MWTTLNFNSKSKLKHNGYGNICRGGLDIEIGRDWSVGLGLVLGEGKKLKYIFPVSGIFHGKADSVILLSFEYSINTQNLNKIARVIFEKIEILNFFLMLTTVNFGGSSKTERTGRRY